MKKQKLLLLLLLAALLVPRWAEAEIITRDNINYLAEGDSVKIIGTDGILEFSGYFQGLDIYFHDNNSFNTSVNILTEIGDRAFYGFNLSHTVSIPSSVRRIGKEAFALPGTKKESTVLYLGGGLREIDDRAFNGREFVTVVINAYNPPILGVDCFSKDKIGCIKVPESRLEAYRAAPGWKDMADKIQGEDLPFLLYNDIAFKINSDDNTVSIVPPTHDPFLSCSIFCFRGQGALPDEFVFEGRKYDNVIIESYAFGNARFGWYDFVGNASYGPFEYVWKLPDYITRIEDHGFSYKYYDNYLNINGISVPIELGKNTTYIGSKAFEGFSIAKQTIICNSPTPPVIADDCFAGSDIGALLTDYPEVYKNAPVWSDLIIGNGEDFCQPLPEGIGYNIFNEEYKLISIYDKGAGGDVVIPMFTEIDGKIYTVTSIGSFVGNNNITSITLPTSISSIPGGGISGLNSYYYDGFANCESLRSIKAPGVTDVGFRAFYNCKELTEVELSSLYCRLDNSFGNCEKLTNSGLKGRFTVIKDPFWGTSVLITEEMILDVREFKGGFGAKIIPEDLHFEGCIVNGDVEIETVSGNIKSIYLNGCSFWLKDNSYPLESGRFELNSANTLDFAILRGISFAIENNMYYDQIPFVSGPIVFKGGANWPEKIYAPEGVPDNLYAYRLQMEQSGMPLWSDAYQSLNSYIWLLEINKNNYEWPRDIYIDANGFIYDSEAKEKLVFAPASGDYELPAGVKTIGKNAFDKCHKLESIKLPETLETIGFRAFINCTALKDIVIPESIKEIGNDAFWDCSSLKSVKLPSSPFSVGDDLFYGTAVEEVFFPEGCTFKGDFYYTIQPGPKRITNMGDGRAHGSIIYDRNIGYVRHNYMYEDTEKLAFSENTKLLDDSHNPSFPKIVKYISEVYDHTGETALGVKYPADAVIDSNYVYSVDRSKLYFAHAGIDLKIAPSVSEINTQALQACGKIGSLSLAASPLALPFPDGALLGTEINSFETDRDWTYAGSGTMFPNLNRVVLGENVRSVPASSFAGAAGLTEIVSKSVNAPRLDATAFSAEQYEKLIPQLPDSIDTYLVLSNGWRNFKSLAGLVPEAEATHTFGDYDVRLTDAGWEIVAFKGEPVDGNVAMPHTFDDVVSRSGSRPVTGIADRAFAGKKGIFSITLPEGIESIGKMAFADCDELVSVDGLKNVKTIGAAAFQNCRKLQDADVSGASVIGAAAFENCKALSEIAFSPNLHLVGQSAFEGCTSLSAVDMRLCSDMAIDVAAFRSCSALRSIEIGAGVRSIGYEAFVNTGLTSLSFAEGSMLESIGDRAFYQTRIRGTVVFPASVSKIGASAFEYARMITDINLPDNPKLKIGDKAFWTCERLASVTWPEKLRLIGDRAFEKTAISGLTVNADSIGHAAFANIASLNYVYLGDRLSHLGAEAFYGSAVKNVSMPTVVAADPVVTIYANTFTNEDNNHSLSHLDLGNKVKTIGNGALMVDGHLDLGSSVETIGAGNGLKSNVEVTIPASLTATKSEISAPSINIDYSPVTLATEADIVARDIFVDRSVDFVPHYYNGNNSYPSFRSPDSLNIVFSDRRQLEYDLNWKMFDCRFLKLHVGASVKSLTSIRGEITFSEGIESLQNGAIEIMQQSLRLPGSLKSIAAGAINNYNNMLEELIIGDSPESISMEQNTFDVISNLKKVYIGRDIKTAANVSPFTLANVTSLQKACFGETVTRVPENMFRNCTSLTNVILPDNITEIGARAYMNCSALDVLSISAKIARIGDEAYRGCTGLHRIVARGMTPPVGNAGFGTAVEDNVMLYVPEAAYEDYLASDLFFAFVNVDTHNEKIVESVVTDANLREAEPGQVIDIVNTYGLDVNLVGSNRNNGPRKAKGRAAANNSDVDLSHSFYWFSTNPDAASVTQEGVVTIHNDRAAEIWAVVLDGSDQKARIGINNIILGDSNDDGFVTVTDAVNTANYAVGNEVNNFFFRSADVNKDENITLSDASGTISILLGQYYGNSHRSKAPALKAIASSGDYLHIGDYKAGEGESAVVDVMLVNGTGYVALQTDVKVPEGMELVSVTEGPRAEGHVLSTARIDDHSMRIVLFDLGNSEFADTDEPVFSLNVKVNSVDDDAIAMSNVLASDAEANEYRLSADGGRNGAAVTGLGDTEDEVICIAVADDGIFIGNAEGRRIAVYTFSGMTVVDFAATSDAERIKLSAGMYIVKAGSKVEKVLIK